MQHIYLTDILIRHNKMKKKLTKQHNAMHNIGVYALNIVR